MWCTWQVGGTFSVQRLSLYLCHHWFSPLIPITAYSPALQMCVVQTQDQICLCLGETKLSSNHSKWRGYKMHPSTHFNSQLNDVLSCMPSVWCVSKTHPVRQDDPNPYMECSCPWWHGPALALMAGTPNTIGQEESSPTSWVGPPTEHDQNVVKSGNVGECLLWVQHHSEHKMGSESAESLLKWILPS